MCQIATLTLPLRLEDRHAYHVTVIQYLVVERALQVVEGVRLLLVQVGRGQGESHS